MTMRSIAIISDHASPLADLGGVDSGGQNVYVKQVAGHLAARGYDVDVFTRRDDPGLPEMTQCSNGVRVVHVTAGPARYIRKEELLQHMQEFTENMLRFCTRKAYDIIHANFWMSGLVALNLKRLLRIPFVITFHALGRIRRLHQHDADQFPDDRFRIEDLIVEECDGIIAECPQDRADLIDLYNAAGSKICIVPCGFDPQELYPVKKHVARLMLGFPPEVPLVLQLGRIVPRKGIDTVISGFARFLRDCSRKACLAVVGGENRTPDPVRDPEIARLHELSCREGIAEQVLFPGRANRDEVKYYFSAADVFVTTPWYEPFGITPLEAMACGTPVVGAAVGGIKFTVKDGVTGRLVPPRDPDALAAALAEIVTPKGMLERMGRNAIERVNRLFTWEIVVRKLLGFYAKAARDRARPFSDHPRFTESVPKRLAPGSGEQKKENTICNR
jgi:glycosyltransferase involved in cell wall biosynthesis